MRALTGAAPTAVVITHAGGGNTTGTARGLKRAGATDTQIVSASVDLSRPAHGERHRLQPQELHDRPHRLRRAVRDVARPRRRAAQRRALAALHGPLPHRHPGRGLLRHRGDGQARGPRARPVRQHGDDRGDVARARAAARRDHRRAGDRVHRRRQAPLGAAQLRARDGRRGARRRPDGERARARSSSSPRRSSRSTRRTSTSRTCARATCATRSRTRPRATRPPPTTSRSSPADTNSDAATVEAIVAALKEA